MDQLLVIGWMLGIENAMEYWTDWRLVVATSALMLDLVQGMEDALIDLVQRMGVLIDLVQGMEVMDYKGQEVTDTDEKPTKVKEDCDYKVQGIKEKLWT